VLLSDNTRTNHTQWLTQLPEVVVVLGPAVTVAVKEAVVTEAVVADVEEDVVVVERKRRNGNPSRNLVVW
jgi:hypothetical protein